MSLSPLGNRIEVGSDAYVIFDAVGEDGQGDLYATPAGGGPIFPVTYSRAHESGPVLSPDGTMLAFLRSTNQNDSAGHRVWIMNLLSGTERMLPESESGWPNRVAWSRDGQRLFVRTAAGDLVTLAPPASPALERADAAFQAQADSSFQVVLGDPPFATVAGCSDGPGLCVPADSGKVQVLTSEGRNPFAWGADSVGYFVGRDIEVRPLGGGITRRLSWTKPPVAPKTATQFPGMKRDTGPPGLRT